MKKALRDILIVMAMIVIFILIFTISIPNEPIRVPEQHYDSADWEGGFPGKITELEKHRKRMRRIK